MQEQLLKVSAAASRQQPAASFPRSSGAPRWPRARLPREARERGDVDDPPPALAQGGQEALGEGEVPHVVDAELPLKAVVGEPEGDGHDARCGGGGIGGGDA